MHGFESVQFLRPPHHQRFYGCSSPLMRCAVGAGSGALRRGRGGGRQAVAEPAPADVLHGYAGAPPLS
eukprot:907331-Rhodomonas_salina.1